MNAADDTSQDQLKTGGDLALDALSQASQSTPALDDSDQEALPAGSDITTEANEVSKIMEDSTDGDDELASSNKLAETLGSLQRVIERNAATLDQLGKELKEKRESLRSVFENDTQLSEAQVQAKVFSEQLKERKAKLQADPQVTSLKVQIGELNEQKKEIEETLSNHLINYYSLTNSTSFDTSDGDQWDFSVRAKVKARKSKD
jgi:chromosome segregation ATPase